MKNLLLKPIKLRNYLPLLLFLFCFLIPPKKSEANVILTKGTIASLCYGYYQTQLTDIIIAEALNNDINAAPGIKTLVISSSTYGRFEPNVGNVTIALNGDITSFSFSVTNTTITISYLCPTITKKDTIRISGLRLQSALSGTVGGSYLYNTGTSTGMINGFPCCLGEELMNYTFKGRSTGILTVPSPLCNYDNTAKTIVSNISGGTFSGTGISSNLFYPAVAGVGTFKIYYTYNYNNCTYTDSTNVTVNAGPSVTITSNDADNTLCQGQTVIFTGHASLAPVSRYRFFKNSSPISSYSTDSNFTSTTSTITNNSNITVLVDNGPGTCVATSSAINNTVISNPNPTVSLPAGVLLCSNDNNNIPITTSPPGGFLSVNSGVNTSTFTFNSSVAGAGSQSITYNVTSGVCTFGATILPMVATSPTVILTSSDADNIICDGNLITFSANTSGTANRYLFIKDSAGLGNPNGIQGPNAISYYATNNLTNGDIMRVTVDNGANTCAATSAGITTIVGKIPHGAYSWKSTCGLNQVTFHDLSSVAGGSTLTKWEWDYTNDASVDYTQLNALPDVIFNYPSTNQYNSRLRVTSDKGCYKDTVIRVYTLPGKTPTITSPYAVNFATSNQGWAYDGSNSSWGWGTAPADFGSLRPIWSTGQISGDGKYFTNEHSYLYGPCVDLTQLDKPMLSIKLSSKITDKPAGAILEASADEGLNWIKVGNVNEGLSWYNVAGIVSTPFSYLANNTNNNPLAQGWATDTINFDNNKLSRISLQQFAGKPSVRLRINFASVADVNAARYAGIGIDSVWIGNRSKRVVLEQFTNTIPASQPGGTIVVNGENAANVMREKRKKDVSAVYYHCSFPEYDLYNAAYPQGPSSRVLYYGVNALPHTVLDGTYYRGNDYTNANAIVRVDTNDVDARALVPARFKMDMSTYISPGNIKAAVRMKYDWMNASFANDVTLHIIIVEDSADGNSKYSSVVRSMLPDAAGSYISKVWNYKDSMDIVLNWSHSLPSTSKLGVVAYIQNAGTKEIYQSVFVKGQGTEGNVVSSLNDPQLENNGVIVFPNPADHEITVLSSSESDNIVSWSLIDNLGRGIIDVQLENQLKGVSINTSGFDNGIYMIRVLTTSGKTHLKKIIIAH